MFYVCRALFFIFPFEFFFKSLGYFSEKHGERFYQDIETMKRQEIVG